MHLWSSSRKDFCWKHLSEAECLGLFVEASRDASESMVSLVLIALSKLCKSGTDTPWQAGMMEGRWWAADSWFYTKVSTLWYFPISKCNFEAFSHSKKKHDFWLSISGFVVEGYLYLGLDHQSTAFLSNIQMPREIPPKKNTISLDGSQSPWMNFPAYK